MHRACTLRSAPVWTFRRGGEDAVGDLREIRQLGEVAKLGAELQRARAQDRLERVLREEEAASRADKLDSGIEAWDVLRDLRARERLDRRDAAVRVVLLLGGAADGVLDARGAEHLEGPQMNVRGAWVDRGSSVTLDRERADSVQARSIAVERPTRLPPTIRTGTLSAADAPSMPL